MLRPLVRSLLLASLCAAGVAHAGTVYVPSPGLGSIGGSAYEVQVSVSNTAAAAGEVKQALLATNTDGTQRSTPATTVIPSHASGARHASAKVFRFSGIRVRQPSSSSAAPCASLNTA